MLFEAPLSPYDWGVKAVDQNDKNSATLAAIANLIDKYRPDVVAVEDSSEARSRRSLRVRKLYRQIAALCEQEVIELYAYPKAAIRAAFKQFAPKSKHDIAVVIASHIPEFRYRIPPKRKIWLPQDPRQSLFDAAALGLTFYAADGRSFSA